MMEYKPLTGSYNLERITLGELDYIETRAGHALSDLQNAPRQAPLLQALAMVAGRREYGHANYTEQDARETPMADIFKAWNLEPPSLEGNKEEEEEMAAARVAGEVEPLSPDRF